MRNQPRRRIHWPIGRQISGEGQASHLPAHGRRAVAVGAVRLQAGAGEARRPACPEEFLKGQRFAFIKGHPKLLGTMYSFAQHGQSGAWFSSLVPHLAGIADDLTIVRSMTTEQFNHAPAQLLDAHGQPACWGRRRSAPGPRTGWARSNQDLPGFIVLVSGGNSPDGGKSVWGNAYLPGVYQGVQCRSAGDPILFVDNPPGMSREVRRRSLDALADLNHMQAREFGSPDTLARIEQYELAFRMQVSVPEVMDISRESPETLASVRRAARRGVVRQQLPAGPPAGRAGRAVRAAVRLGLGRPRHGRQRRPRASASQEVPGDRSAARRRSFAT